MPFCFQTDLECLFGGVVVGVPPCPRLGRATLHALAEQIDEEEDVLVVRKRLLPELHHQLPEGLELTADVHH